MCLFLCYYLFLFFCGFTTSTIKKKNNRNVKHFKDLIMLFLHFSVCLFKIIIFLKTITHIVRRRNMKCWLDFEINFDNRIFTVYFPKLYRNSRISGLEITGFIIPSFARLFKLAQLSKPLQDQTWFFAESLVWFWVSKAQSLLPDLLRTVWCWTSPLPRPKPPAPGPCRLQDCSRPSASDSSRWQESIRSCCNTRWAEQETPSPLHTDPPECYHWIWRGKAACRVNTRRNSLRWSRTFRGRRQPTSRRKETPDTWRPWRWAAPGWLTFPPSRTGCCWGTAPGWRWCRKTPRAPETRPAGRRRRPDAALGKSTLICKLSSCCPKEECSRSHPGSTWCVLVEIF